MCYFPPCHICSAENPLSGLGSVIVFLSTIFALMSGVKDGFAALVIVQAGVFADASRRLVR